MCAENAMFKTARPYHNHQHPDDPNYFQSARKAASCKSKTSLLDVNHVAVELAWCGMRMKRFDFLDPN
jgi:hypothetical protein